MPRVSAQEMPTESSLGRLCLGVVSPKVPRSMGGLLLSLRRSAEHHPGVEAGRSDPSVATECSHAPTRFGWGRATTARGAVLAREAKADSSQIGPIAPGPRAAVRRTPEPGEVRAECGGETQGVARETCDVRAKVSSSRQVLLLSTQFVSQAFRHLPYGSFHDHLEPHRQPQ